MRHSSPSAWPRGHLRAELLLGILCWPALEAAVLEDIQYRDPVRAKRVAEDSVRTWRIPRARQRPRIDGHLSEPCWGASGSCLGAFSIGLSKVPARHSREAWAAYDDRALYFGVKLQREAGKPLRAFTHEPDNAHIWEDDEVELFFDPFGTGREHFQLILNSEGVLFDAKHRLRMVHDPAGAGPRDRKRVRDTDVTWASNLERAVHVTDRYWAVEMALPLKAIGLAGAPAGHRLHFNITSADWDTKEYTCLTPTSDWHDPRQFGALALGPRRIAVRRLELEGVGFGENSLGLTVENLTDRVETCRATLSFQTETGTIRARAPVIAKPGQVVTQSIPFSVQANEGRWDADLRIIDRTGVIVFAGKRTGGIPPQLTMRLDSQAAFTDGMPVGLAARIGFGSGTRRQLALAARLLDDRGRPIRKQDLGAPGGPLLRAIVPVQGLKPGQYRVRLVATQTGRMLAQCDEQMRLGHSPFLKQQ